jgi:L-lactate utilization protein LutC
VGLVIILIVRAATFIGTQSAGDQGRILSLIMTIVQFIVTLSTLVLVRSQVSVAVHQIEQAEVNELRLQQLTEGVRKLAVAVGESVTSGP